MTVNITNLKKNAAAKAIEFIKNDMVLGLGTGSTIKFAIDLLGTRLKSGALKGIVAIATSEATTIQARSLNIPLGNLADYSQLDLAIDGADEVTPNFNLTKGWGGALVREKLIEIYAQRFIVMVDDSKLVTKLGTRGPIPIEVTPFAWQAQAKWLEKMLNCNVTLRQTNNHPYLTDNKNYILNCTFANGISNPQHIQNILANRPGIVGHGLFLDMATDIIVGSASNQLWGNKQGDSNPYISELIVRPSEAGVFHITHKKAVNP